MSWGGQRFSRDTEAASNLRSRPGWRVPTVLKILIVAMGASAWGPDLAVSDGPAAPPAPAEVKLVSGRALKGRVAGQRDIEGTRMLEIATDYGTILVAASEVRTVTPGTIDPEATFVADGIRVVRIQGTVERQTSAGGDWMPVKWTDAYGKEIVNSPNAIVRPGDRLRTAAGGELDFQMHKDTWIRVAEESELQIPGEPASPASLSLLRGRLLHQVEGRPRGATFRVSTPAQVLGVRGTRFAVTARPTGTVVEVADGTVNVGGGPDVVAGQRAELLVKGEPSLRALTQEELSELTVQVVRVPPESLAWIPGGRYTLGDGKDVQAPTPAPADLSKRIGGFLPETFGDDTSPTPDSSNIDVSVTAVLPGFLIDRRECSIEEYAAFAAMRDVPLPSAVASHQAAPSPDRRPVWGVSWHRAFRYACWVGRRLPSEAQWEMAARGRERRLWPWGNRLTPKHEALPAWRDCTIVFKGFYVPGHFINEPNPCLAVRPVDEPTIDVTPQGVEGLVSGVPEWTRDWLPGKAGERLRLRAPSEDGLRPPGAPSATTPDFKIVRGAYLSARWAIFRAVWLSRDSDDVSGPGLRCVVEPE